MAHNSTLVQSGEDFYIVGEDGSWGLLEVPSTVTVTTERPPRFEVKDIHAIVVNSVDQPLIVDDTGIVLFMSPRAPTAAPTLAVGSAGALTGTYQVKYTFAIRSLDDVIVAESGFSPAATVVLAADNLAVSALQLLTGLDPVNYSSRYEVVRRAYRTVAGGSTFFLWFTVADNTTTSFEDDLTDAELSVLASPSLGTSPFLSHIASFKERLFGVDDSTNREVLLYSEIGLRWAWPTDNFFTMPQTKGDSQSGITALMPFRNSLGITKSNMLISLTGTDDSTFNLTTLSTSIGCVSQESCAQYRDAWYFLGQDGVYRWSESGIDCVSDGKVRTWFASDTYFNREEFGSAFGVVDVIDKTYRLYMALAGETTVRSWVEFDIESGTWWGPHTTSAYNWRSAFRLGAHTPTVGVGSSTGYIAVNTAERNDDGFLIVTEAVTTPIRATDPPATAYFGSLTTEVDPQFEGTLSVFPVVGELSESEDTAFSHDISIASVDLGRLGYGRYLQLRFYHATINQIIQLLGFEVDPVNIVGRRQ